MSDIVSVPLSAAKTALTRRRPPAGFVAFGASVDLASSRVLHQAWSREGLGSLEAESSLFFLLFLRHVVLLSEAAAGWEWHQGGGSTLAPGQGTTKMLLPLSILQLLLAPALAVPSVDHWDTWGPYGECSRSCGSGVTMRTRRCITLRTDGGHNCVGPEKSYRSCNIQDCPEGSRDFREEQCSGFDGIDFQGKRYKWLPYYGAENPCELNCMPRGENFFYRHRSAVVDGTPCHPGRRDVCVGGVCKRLGCDNMLESAQQEDPCLQCGGSGQSCHRVKNSFSVRDLPTGYNQMFIIPVGATTISIRETVATRNYLAIKNLRGEYYLNGHWVIEFSRATPVAGTMLYYQRGAEGDNVPETLIGRGPTTEPLVVELISQEPNQGVEYEFYLPNGRSREGYYWSFGSWSSCSRECGSGYQSRLVFCTVDNEAYPDYLCASLPRPQTNRTCNPHPCPGVRSYGCCRDGVTAARGPHKEGCAEFVAPAPTAAPSLPTENAVQCRTTAYGCCYDRTTPAGGPSGEGCPNPPNHIERSICSLPRGAGSCSSWVPRYHFDVITSQCAHFWYGGCHGNSNNFVTRAECQSVCQRGPQPPVAPAGGPASRRESAPARGAGAGGSTAGGSTGGQSRNMGRIFTVQGGSTGATGRQATSAAANAHRGRFYLRGRRPAPVTAAQHSSPAASLTLGEVTIDKSDPSTVEALVGQTVVLPCRVSPPPSSTVVVEWRRDGVPLSTHRHHQQPNGSLLVGPLTKSDSGWFLCVATRERERDHRYIYLSVSEGSSQLIPTSLPRDGPFPRFSIDRSSPSLLEMRAGQTARLPCVVVPPSALQSVTVQWTKDGQTLSGSRFTQRSDGTLTFGGLRSEDSGVYTCTASSRQQLEQRQLQLRVQADLKITTAPNNIQVSEGRTALLPCVVSGDNINIRWSRNGVPVRPDGRDILLSSDGSLVLNRVKPSDEGTYTCNAYTGIYSVSATAEVRVIKDSQRGVDVPPECVDQPELANCELIVYARLCSNSYYSSFCCASCTRHSQKSDRPGRLG
ncbi:papilin isoform X4 [Scophthalmus maximus]|uniref:papilin isoform X4 n=1 Tax=Scophthalmus maximus TaxID=52904 RepID=UPI001FA82CA7|nr:papilin isoform X4 [Scophthalmus maximus]